MMLVKHIHIRDKPSQIFKTQKKIIATEVVLKRVIDEVNGRVKDGRGLGDKQEVESQ